jgi:hypothetical protein
MKDKRFTLAGKLIRTNEIKTLSGIIDLVPKTVVAKELGIKPERFNKVLDNIELFVVKDLVKLADSLEIELKAVLNVLDNELASKRKTKRK